MRAPENYKYTQAAAGNGTAFTILFGGLFQVAVVATFGGGTVELQVLGPDNATWLSIYDVFASSATTPVEFDLVTGIFKANGVKNFNLPAGVYRYVATTATVLSATIASIPGE